jgi:hypothetical protein
LFATSRLLLLDVLILYIARALTTGVIPVHF